MTGIRRNFDDLAVDSSEALGLTAEERQLLPLLATSLSLTDIAGLLGLPREEVEAQTASLYRKLGLRSNAGS